MYPITKSMKLLTRAERKSIMRSVQRGESIEDLSKAILAVEYARRYRRVAKWLAIGLFVIGILGGAVALIQRSWLQLGFGVFLTAYGCYFMYLVSRATRSIALNEAMLT